jgi:hypothetical protein
MVGIIFFGYGLISFIFAKKFRELWAIIISSIALLFLPLGCNGERGYLVPFLYFFVIFISFGCWTLVNQLAEKFGFSKSAKRIFLAILVILMSFYFFFPITKNYFFNKNYKPVEYLMAGEWFKNNVPDFEKKTVFSRKPEIAFYAESNWQGISGNESLEQIMNSMIKQNWQYLILDSRSLKENSLRLIAELNQKKNFDKLRLLKEMEYNDEKIYIYKLN